MCYAWILQDLLHTKFREVMHVSVNFAKSAFCRYQRKSAVGVRKRLVALLRSQKHKKYRWGVDRNFSSRKWS